MTRTATLYKGFTLLEVMMAVAILGLLLTAILSSEAGAVKMAHRSRKTEIAVPLVRCKMGEIEEQMAKEGFPALYASGSDECCKEAQVDGFSCDWTVNRIVLPETMFLNEDEDGQLKGGKGKSSAKDSLDLAQVTQNKNLPIGSLDLSQAKGLGTGSLNLPGQTGALGAGGPLGAEGPMDVTQLLMGGTGGISDGIANLALPFIYPVLKPFIEDQIRRATVKVKWYEGEKEHSFEIVQYLIIEQPPLTPINTSTGTTTTGSQSTGGGSNLLQGLQLFRGAQ